MTALSEIRPLILAAWWTTHAVARAKRELRYCQFDSVNLPRVPRVPPTAERAVLAVLRCLPATCLERATVMQAWHAAHGVERDLIIGVTSPASGFEAHAWLEGDTHCHNRKFRELVRLPPE